ncbi:unnamed protein product [Ambrosiozyma monospora]|uniref:Unnamed protein product n=2 Tax=Ambrosiozyma monospora TaxID=43982 RepID=A0ACB5T4D8_AMBMO|nr:unnamed protein product [Ambrosiozyma monospora]
MEAKPLNRLQKSYELFKLRRTEFESNPENRHAVRHVLGNSSGTGLGSGRSSRPNSKSSIQIYSDKDHQKEASPGNNENPGVWRNLDTIKNSKKENTLQPTSWNGQKLTQQKSKRAPLQEKVTVFRDSELKYPVTKLVEIPGKRTERLDYNLDLFVPSDGENQPRTYYEILAHMRGLYLTDQKVRVSRKRKQEQVISPPVSPVKRAIIEIPLGEDDNDTKMTHSPTQTLTYYSKAASNDIAAIFNKSQDKFTDSEGDVEVDGDGDGDAGAESELDVGGLSDYVTETITKPMTSTTLANKADLEIKQELQTPKKTSRDDFELMSSPFMENPPNITTEREPILIDPFDINLQKNLLNRMNPSLQSHPNYSSSLSTSNRLRTLKKLIKPNMAPALGQKQTMVELGSSLFCLTKELGEGGYATVYLSETPDGQQRALKIESPANEWEFYIMTQLYKRSSIQTFIQPEQLFVFRDESFLLLPYLKQGTVLDLVRLTSQPHGIKLDESLTIYLTIQLIKQMLELHSIGIIHGDLKPDNCMIDFNATSQTRKPTFKDVIIIDYGRSIDISLLPSNVRFQTNLTSTDSQDCPQFRNGESYFYEPDYYGVANIVHTLLFGKFIEVRQINDRVVLVDTIRRYWQKSLWDEFFNLMLNSSGDHVSGSSGVRDKLKTILKKFEDWHKLNYVACGLVDKISKIDTALGEKTKKRKN